MLQFASLAPTLLGSFLLISSSCCDAFVHPNNNASPLVHEKRLGHLSSTNTVLLRSSVSKTSEEWPEQQEPTATATSAEPTPSVAQRCYEAWNNGQMNDAVSCFSDNFTYDDGQYLGTITDKSILKRTFERNSQLFPPNSKMIIDNIAIDPINGNIGSCWHVEREDGTTVPLTRGCSFYTIDEESGLIKSGFKVSEMLVKPSKSFSNNLVNSSSKLIQASESLGEGSNKPEQSTINQLEEQESKSIIEQYFQAWNDRDMDAALDCFTDNCTYQTEDPVFVDTFRGKDALREHLLKNAATLPSSCQIILDDLAIDLENGTFGVKWHLEVNEVAIPNLRGCSMYTMDMDTGLLKSGYDVTEAPVKFPEFVQELFAVPFGKLLF